MDILDFTRSVEVIDAHIHMQRSVAHTQELYHYFLYRGAARSGPASPPVIGTLDQVQAMMERTGVRHANVLMFTWSGMYYRDGQFTLPDDPVDRARADAELRQRIARRICDYNEWALQTALQNSNLSCFVGIDPVVMGERAMLAEIEDKIRRGAKGVKSQFTDSGILANDRRLWPLYDYLQAHEIPLQMVCAKWAPGLNRPAHCSEALADFPKLRLIFSHIGHGHHFGQGTDAEFLELAQKYPYVCGDLSLRLPEVIDGQIAPDALVAHLRRIGTDRVFYGSNFSLNEMLRPGPAPSEGDFQMSETLKGLAALATLPLTEDERADIAGRNFRRWVGLGR